jgi:nucleoside-diphosphate-sugar epimerase
MQFQQKESRMSDKLIVVTGAGGFIGGSLVASLRKKGGFTVGTNAKKVASRAFSGGFFHHRTSKMEIPDHSSTIVRV